MKRFLTTYEKFIKWVTSAGFRSVGYLIGAVAAFVLLGSGFIAGALVGVFVSDNFVTIKELIEKNFE